jgi:nitroimidazol reductase NimA-like FMN-containing flavoprotein (pyridoxamine 5'-phosphate oxidase superfamily)
MSNDDIARSVLDGGTYVVLATAGRQGTPWASPVWYAMADYRTLYWVSHPGARHSQNIVERPRIAMVVFDSTVPPGTGQGVYMSADAQQVIDPDGTRNGVAVVSATSVRQGAKVFTLGEVTGDARLRLYRATVHEHSILDPDSPYDIRVPVTP